MKTEMTLNVSRFTTTVKSAKPFGAHFTTRLEDVNNKLVCALSAAPVDCDGVCCGDDAE
jgi:hypothetical protein